MADYEYTELSVAEMIVGLKNRIKEYEGRKFQIVMDCKIEEISQNPAKDESLRMLRMQDEDLTKALEITKQDLAALEAQSENAVTD